MAYHGRERGVGIADVRHIEVGEIVGAGYAVVVDAGVEAAVRAVAVDEDAGILRTVVKLGIAHGAYLGGGVTCDRPAYFDGVRALDGRGGEGHLAVRHVGRPARHVRARGGGAHVVDGGEAFFGQDEGLGRAVRGEAGAAL